MRGNHERGTPNKTDKGCKDGSCNVTACQAPIGKSKNLDPRLRSAQYYNHVMRAWYCLCCTREIQHYATLDGVVLFKDYCKEQGLI